MKPDVDDGTGAGNQFIAWLMADPVSGLAPARWQSRVGPCTVVRTDGHGYTPDDHGVLHDFMGPLSATRQCLWPFLTFVPAPYHPPARLGGVLY